MKSLDFMDQTPERMKAVMEKTGMEKMAAIYKGAGEIILSGETFLMAINPKMSYVSKELASQDPDFWMPKAPAAVKPAAKPADKTTGAGQ
jgi:hypothetical protein